MLTQEELDAYNFLPYHYYPDLDTEELLFDGRRLMEGMEVVTGERSNRTYPHLDMSETAMENAKITNYWCLVGQVHVDEKAGQVRFIATYDDGRVVKRHYPITDSWIVKKESIPEIVDPWLMPDIPVTDPTPTGVHKTFDTVRMGEDLMLASRYEQEAELPETGEQEAAHLRDRADQLRRPYKPGPY